jgi:integrase
VSIRKRVWQSGGSEKSAWVADYSDQEGKRHQKAFATKRQANGWLAETKHEIGRGIHTPSSGSISITEAGQLWLEQAEVDGLERSTLAQYAQHLKFHISPYLADVKLCDFTPARLTQFRNTLVKGGRSAALVRGVTTSLGAILANAVSLGKVSRNVVREQSRSNRHSRLTKRHEKHLEIGVDLPTKAELKIMLERAQGKWRVLLETALFTALRASELRGLRWSDVDFASGTLTVRQRADRWGTIGSPKSDSGKREIPLDKDFLKVLKEWRLACPKGELDLVFPNSRGKVDSLPNWHRRGLGVIQVAAGITTDPAHPKYGLHAFRHCAASLWIEQGFTAKRVQALMGHSSITTTFDVYGHLFAAPETDKAAMAQVRARLIGG